MHPFHHLFQASSKQLHGGKVVHLRVVLKSIVPAGKNASAVLKDPTGTKPLYTSSVPDSHMGRTPCKDLVPRRIGNDLFSRVQFDPKTLCVYLIRSGRIWLKMYTQLAT